MSKEEAVKQLNDKEFSTRLENGVVVIEVRSESERARAKRAIREIGYDASWGVRGVMKHDYT